MTSGEYNSSGDQFGKTKDVRGRNVTMLNPKSMYLFGRYGSIDGETLGAIVDEIEPGARRGIRLAVWVGIPLIVIVIGIVVLSLVLEGSDALGDLTKAIVISPAIFGGVVGSLIASFAGQRQQRIRRTRHALLTHQLCPHCGYNLRDLPLAPSDGATICPECACAWHLDEPYTADPDSGGAKANRSRSMQLKMTLLIIGLAVLFALGIVFFIANL